MHKYPPTIIYQQYNNCLKVALSVLEQGLIKKDSNLNYNARKVSWLSKLSKDLEGEVSRATIDQCLDRLLDQGMLAHGTEIMQKVKDGDTYRWVRAYHIGNEFVDKLINLYKESHEI